MTPALRARISPHTRTRLCTLCAMPGDQKRPLRSSLGVVGAGVAPRGTPLTPDGASRADRSKGSGFGGLGTAALPLTSSPSPKGSASSIGPAGEAALVLAQSLTMSPRPNGSGLSSSLPPCSPAVAASLDAANGGVSASA
eukprot:207888-Prymnesium_polylepis.1